MLTQKFSISVLIFIFSLQLVSLKAQEQQSISIIQVCDLSSSMLPHMYITQEQVESTIDEIRKRGGGTLSFLFTLDNRVAPLRLRIPNLITNSYSGSALNKVSRQSEKALRLRLFEKEKVRFLEQVNLYINSRHQSTPLDKALQLTSRMLHEPFDKKIVLILSDGYDSFSANRCASTQLDSAFQIGLIGWENDSCLPSEAVSYFFDFDTAFDNFFSSL